MNKREKLKKLIARMEELAAKLQDSGWTDEERDEFKSSEKEAGELKSQIEEEDRQAREDRESAERFQTLKTSVTTGTRRTQGNQAALREGGGSDQDSGGNVNWVRDGWQSDPMRGFRDHVDFLSQVKSAAKYPGEVSPQLKAMAAGSDEHGTHDDTKGGFLVARSMLGEVMTGPVASDPTASLVDSIQMDTPVVDVPYLVDKDHSTSVSGGLNWQWRSETQAADASELKLGEMEFRAHTLMGKTYTTRELMERSFTSFVSLLRNGFRRELASKLLKSKLYGNGNGKMLGILDAACTITVPKEGGQGADTINGDNLINMLARHYEVPDSNTTIWLANKSCLPQLVKAHTTMTNSDQPIFVHGNGTTVPNTLLNYPIFFTEHCKQLGDLGDIILGDWSQFLVGEYMPLREESSIHVRFENHEQVFKFWIEIAGAPRWETFLTPENGPTQSPFVVLEAR